MGFFGPPPINSGFKVLKTAFNSSITSTSLAFQTSDILELCSYRFLANEIENSLIQINWLMEKSGSTASISYGIYYGDDNVYANQVVIYEVTNSSTTRTISNTGANIWLTNSKAYTRASLTIGVSATTAVNDNFTVDYTVSRKLCVALSGLNSSDSLSVRGITISQFKL